MKSRYLYRAFKARYREQRRELRAVLRQLAPGDIAVDVGAHKGAYTYWMRKAVGAEGKVFAFEPQARLATYLQSVCLKMKWNNVTVLDCALSDQPGTKTLFVPGPRDSPGASLNACVSSGQSVRHCECPLSTLDLEVQDAGRITMIKVDVEGHELEALRGGSAILERDRPLLLIECEERHLQNHTMHDVFAYLDQLGYDGAFFSRGGLLPLNRFDVKKHQKRDSERFWDAPDYCNNFLFRARA